MKIVIHGEKELTKALEELGRTGRSVTRKAMRKAVKPLTKDMKRRARPHSKSVSKSIGVHVKTFKRSGTVVARVGPRSDSKVWRRRSVKNPFTGETESRITKPHKIAHLIEGGTSPHQIRLPHLNITVQHPGTEAHPYMEPAYNTQSNEVLQNFTRDAWDEIEKTARKNAAKEK